MSVPFFSHLGLRVRAEPGVNSGTVFWVLRVVVAAGFGVAGFFSIWRAAADFEFGRGTPAGVARAVELAPSDAEYLLLRGLEIDYDGGDATPLLERAARLTPMSSAPRIRLGLAAEIRGDDAQAERWLLEAARIDRQFEPRWTLANFYFRHENFQEFWKWTRAALEVSYGDRRPVFDLCWRTGATADEIARAIPERREVLGAYLSYLIGTQRIDAAAPVAVRLTAFHDGADQAVLLGACDAFIAAGNADAAMALWRGLFGEYSGVFHANFEAPRIGDGFDWRSGDVAGVVQIDLDDPASRRITLSGQEPESCELLRQTLALEPGRAYTLRWRSTASGAMPGMEWRIGEAHAGLSAGELKFVAKSRLSTLALVYARPEGEARAEGWVEIAGVTVN